MNRYSVGRLEVGHHGRFNTQKWLRRIHAWIGLSLAAIVLLFSVTGFLLNHRAEMKIPAFSKDEVRQVVELSVRPTSPAELFHLAAPGVDASLGTLRITKEASKELFWEGQRIKQPERWRIALDSPSRSTLVEYWVGNTQAEVLYVRPNLWLHLARLHMAIGTGPAWVLLSDMMAITLATLSLSGFWLWGRLHGTRNRLGLLALTGTAVMLAIGILAG